MILLAILAALAAGMSPLVWTSPLAPMMVGGIFAAAAIGVAWLRKPNGALYAAIFLLLLPRGGFIPRDLQDELVELVMGFALLSWFLNAVFRRRPIVLGSTNLLMISFVIWSIVTLTWASNFELARAVFLSLIIDLALLLLIVNEIDSLPTLNGLMSTLAISGWILVLAGLNAVITQTYEISGRLVVMGMNVNEYGISLIVTMPGVLWPSLWPPKQQGFLRKISGYLFILLTLILIAFSGSRGSLISFFAILSAFWLWKPTRPWGKLTLLLSAMAIVTTPFVFSKVLDRFATGDGGALGGRMVIWEAAWMLIRDHPWIGVGIGNAPEAVLPYLKQLIDTGSHYTHRSLHNAFLAVWAETGIFGLMLYLSVLTSAVWSFVRQVRQHGANDMSPLTCYLALTFCIFVGYTLSWIKSGGFEYHHTCFLMLGLLLVPTRLSHME
ncbi:MAG: O-antigen ligase family protein [Anaerolineae bacterium]|nr:O-antigen ligase family protein [Anaerolineae bacterium]